LQELLEVHLAAAVFIEDI
jgi:hypothetical protein